MSPLMRWTGWAAALWCWPLVARSGQEQPAVRGIKILVDGTPQTLPDGQGQLTNIELGEVDRIEVLRGSTSGS
ncbi:MAG TPA: TonB-dependent receptor plug domain-containing protein [Gemmatimonadales bacterium]|nr:TonB-dependent receptor plug domain-containing protein [Gemmatimonadales bacterium]